MDAGIELNGVILLAGPSRSPSPRPPPLVSQAESADPTDPLTSIHLRLDRLESQQPSVTRTELEELRSEIRAGRGPPETHSGVSEARMRELLAENDRTWTERLRLLEEAWRARLAGLEGILSSRLTTLEERTKYWEEGVPRNPASAQPKPLPEFTLTSETPASVRARLGKRPHGDTPSTTLPSRHDLSDPTPARKRARIDLREQSVEAVDDEGDSRTLDEPRTPSPPKAVPVTFKTPSLPHTPSPGHQGVSSDNSATPIVGTDYFANPPHLSASSRKRKRAIEELPYPIFATTPKPSEPVSPTTDAPPSASRGRNAAAAMLTPGRVRKESTPAPRAVSNAHKELSTITESDETPIHRRSRVPSDVPTPAFLGPELELDRRPGTASPTGLSPSPSIDAGPSYIPAPSVSRRVFSATSSRPHRGSSSPARDYMNVALHGLRNDTESPSAQATPGHRTMLGTERYRDTRFGDVPVFQWGTPSVDLGPGTPGQAQREW